MLAKPVAAIFGICLLTHKNARECSLRILGIQHITAFVHAKKTQGKTVDLIRGVGAAFFCVNADTGRVFCIFLPKRTHGKRACMGKAEINLGCVFVIGSARACFGKRCI